MVSSTMLARRTAETAPAPLRYFTYTVLVPSPGSKVYGALPANGCQGPNVVPSLEKAISSTGSPGVGLVADRLRVTAVLLVYAAPPLICNVPLGLAASR